MQIDTRGTGIRTTRIAGYDPAGHRNFFIDLRRRLWDQRIPLSQSLNEFLEQTPNWWNSDLLSSQVSQVEAHLTYLAVMEQREAMDRIAQNLEVIKKNTEVKKLGWKHILVLIGIALYLMLLGSMIGDGITAIREATMAKAVLAGNDAHLSQTETTTSTVHPAEF